MAKTGFGTTSLASQLNVLRVAPSAGTRVESKRLSFLYDEKLAATIDSDTHYANALAGLESLKLIDPKIEAYEKTLFSESSKKFERGLQSKEANERLDKEIQTFLFNFVTPYFSLTSTHKVLEWLVYRYQINLYNPDDLLVAVLPYHETVLFVRAAQLCVSAINTETGLWHFLRPLLKFGKPIPKSALLTEALQRPTLFSLLIDKLDKAITDSSSSDKNKENLLLSLVTSLLITALNQGVGESFLKVVMEFLTPGLKSSNVSWNLASYCVICLLSIKMPLNPKYLRRILRTMKNGYLEKTQSSSNNELHRNFIRTLTIIFHYQYEGIEKLSLSIINSIDDESLVELNQTKNIEKFMAFFLTTLLVNIKEDGYKKRIDGILMKIHLSPFVVTQCISTLSAIIGNGCENDDSLLALLCDVATSIERKFPESFDRALSKNPRVASLISSAKYATVSSDQESSSLMVVDGVKSANEEVRLASYKNILVQLDEALVRNDQNELDFIKQALKAVIYDDSLSIISLFFPLADKMHKLFSPSEMIEWCRQILLSCKSKRRTQGSDQWLGLEMQVLHSFVRITAPSHQDQKLATLWPYFIPQTAEEMEFVSLMRSNKTDIVTLDMLLSSIDEKAFAHYQLFVVELSRTVSDVILSGERQMVQTLFPKDDSAIPDENSKMKIFALLIFEHLTKSPKLACYDDYNAHGLAYLSLISQLLATAKRKISHFEMSAEELAEKSISTGRPTLAFLLLHISVILNNMRNPSIADNPWDWHALSQTNCYIFKLLTLLCDESQTAKLWIREHFEPLLAKFIKSQNQRFMIKLLSSRWTNSFGRIKMQSRSLALFKGIFKRHLKLDIQDFTSLLAALNSPAPWVRKLAADILSNNIQVEKCNRLVQYLSSWSLNFHTDEAMVTKLIADAISSPESTGGQINFLVDFMVSTLLSDKSPSSIKLNMLKLMIDVTEMNTIRKILPFMVNHVNKTSQDIIEKRCGEAAIKLLAGVIDQVTSSEDEILSAFLAYLSSPTYRSVTISSFQKGWFAAERPQSVKFHLIDSLLSHAKEDQSSRIPKQLRRIAKSGRFISEYLIRLLEGDESSPAIGRKRKRPMSTIISQDNPRFQNCLTLLAAAQSTKKLKESSQLMSSLFQLLSEVIVAKDTLQADPVLHQILALIDKCLGSDEKVDIAGFRLEYVLDCLRESQSREVQRVALGIVARVSLQMKTEILLNMPMIFAWVGNQTRDVGDEFSMQTIIDAMDTIIPAVYEQDPTIRDQLITIFVDSLPDIPVHRQLALFDRMMRILGMETSAILVLLKIADRIVTKKETERAQAEYFMVSLCFLADFPTLLSCMNSLMEVLHKLIKNQSPPEMSDIRQTKVQRREFMGIIAGFLLKVLNEGQFLQFAAEYQSNWQQVDKLFQNFLQKLLSSIEETNRSFAADKDTSLVSTFHEIIGVINNLLPTEYMVNMLVDLLDNESTAIKRKAIEMLTTKLQSTYLFKMTADSAKKLLIPLFNVVSILNTTYNETTVNTAQHALLAIKLIAKNFVEKPSLREPFTRTLTLIIETADKLGQRINLALVASASLCASQITSSIKQAAIPHLPPLIKLIFRLLESNDDIHILSGVASLVKVTGDFTKFLGSYLDEILFKFSKFASRRKKNANLNGKMSMVETNLVEQTPSPSLIKSLFLCYEKLERDETLHSKEPYIWLMSLSKTVYDRMDISDAETLSPEIQRFMLKAIDHRNLSTKDNLFNENLETKAIEALVAFVPKLSENYFRTFFYKLVDWALKTKEKRSRMITFFKSTALMSEKLRSLFCQLAAPYIVTHVTKRLNEYNPCSEDTPRPCDKEGHELILAILKTLANCFLYDTGNVFLTRDRLETLVPAILDQLSNREDSEELYSIRFNEGILPSIQNLATGASEESYLKRIHQMILLKTRESDSQIRLHAVLLLHSFVLKLEEEYLPLLPEAMPYIAELSEDENEQIELLVHKLMNEMERILGEPLDKYLR